MASLDISLAQKLTSSEGWNINPSGSWAKLFANFGPNNAPAWVTSQKLFGRTLNGSRSLIIHPWRIALFRGSVSKCMNCEIRKFRRIIGGYLLFASVYSPIDSDRMVHGRYPFLHIWQHRRLNIAVCSDRPLYLSPFPTQKWIQVDGWIHIFTKFSTYAIE